jgi:hypothetical protein
MRLKKKESRFDYLLIIHIFRATATEKAVRFPRSRFEPGGGPKYPSKIGPI